MPYMKNRLTVIIINNLEHLKESSQINSFDWILLNDVYLKLTVHGQAIQ